MPFHNFLMPLNIIFHHTQYGGFGFSMVILNQPTINMPKPNVTFHWFGSDRNLSSIYPIKL